VMGLLLFHVEDEKALASWQSGLYYVDGTPKSSLGPVRDAIGAVHRNAIADCPGLKLTPKATLKALTPTATSTRVSLTCDIDCTWTAQLGAGKKLRGSATGGVATTLVFPQPIASRRLAQVWTLAKRNVGSVGHAQLALSP
jgi:hypothetical protein